MSLVKIWNGATYDEFAGTDLATQAELDTHAADLTLHGGGLLLDEVVFESNWDHPNEAGGYSTITGSSISFEVPASPQGFMLQAQLPLISTVSTDTLDFRIVDGGGSAIAGMTSDTVNGDGSDGYARLFVPVPLGSSHAPTAGSTVTYQIQARRASGTGQVSLFVAFGSPLVAVGFFRAFRC